MLLLLLRENDEGEVRFEVVKEKEGAIQKVKKDERV